MAREFKDSGIEWIGKIPKEWKTNKVNRLFRLIGSGTTPNSSDDDAYIGTINWLQSGDINGSIITNANKRISKETLAKYSALSVYEAPFIVVAMYGASVGNISISHINACVNQACCVMSESKIHFSYAFYTIKSAQRYLIYRAVGGGQPNISQNTLRQLSIPEPPLPEQQRIADYLDKKCGEIDELIALQDQMIAQLTDYKQSVITEAVTKGLNPDVELVPSGIDWIGDVPKEWKITRVKFYGTIRSGDGISIEKIKDEGTYPVWGGNGLIGYAEKYNETKTSIVIGRVGALCGNVRLLTSPTFVSDNALIFRLSDKVDSKYMLWLLIGADLNRLNTSNAQPLITGTKVKNVYIPLPPLSEQQSIASYLDTKCSEIDSLVAIKQQKIETLKDYKKSVIYEAVTGKITV